MAMVLFLLDFKGSKMLRAGPFGLAFMFSSGSFSLIHISIIIIVIVITIVIIINA